MTQIKMISTANAGLLIDLGEKKLLIDAFHSEKYELYPTVSPALFRQILASPIFADPDVLLYTHCHPDHFSSWMTEEARRAWPDMTVLLPEPKADGTVLTKPVETFRFGELELTLCRLPHESVQYRSVPHYGVLIKYGPVCILDPGDCEIASEKLTDFIGDTKIDLAILNFPWLALRKGRDFVKNVIRPKHMLIHHLPEESEDPLGYRENLKRTLARNFSDCDVRIFGSPLEETVFEL